MSTKSGFQPLSPAGRAVSWIMPATAVVGVNACLLISIGTGAIEPTFPYLDGEVSISKASRQPYARFLFRTMAVALAAMGVFWWLAAGRRFGRAGAAAAALGIVAVCNFLLYAFVLGETGQHLTRRAAVYFFLACTIAGQVVVARQVRAADPSSRAGKALLAYTYALVPVCISIAPLSGWLLGDFDRGENVAEWNTFVLMLAFFPFAGEAMRARRA